MMLSEVLTLIRPDDWHLHVRDGTVLKDVLLHSARQFARAIIMPNLSPPITTANAARAYRERILDSLGESVMFEPLMTLYLTDKTTRDEIKRAKDSGFIHAFKLYPAGATTNSDAGVSNLCNMYNVLETMQDLGMPLLVHGEVTDSTVDIFDREAVFIETVLQPLRNALPELKIVLEHVTTKNAIDYVSDSQGPIAATITAHHLLYNRNEIFKSGIRPHYYCLPVLKREIHRKALLSAATSKNPRFFLGTDSAPHAQSAKESACGCAGCYTALHALELYATAFDSIARLDALETFACFNGPDFYGLPRNTQTITLKKITWQIPDALDFADEKVIPLNAGGTLNWKLL